MASFGISSTSRAILELLLSVRSIKAPRPYRGMFHGSIVFSPGSPGVIGFGLP